MTFNYIVLLIAWTVLLIVTVLQQRTIKHQTKANDYLLDDIARLESRNKRLNEHLEDACTKYDISQAKLKHLKEVQNGEKFVTDTLMSENHDLQERVQELEGLLKRLDPNKLTVDFDDGLKPYASTVGEIVDKHVK